MQDHPARKDKHQNVKSTRISGPQSLRNCFARLTTANAVARAAKTYAAQAASGMKMLTTPPATASKPIPQSPENPALIKASPVPSLSLWAPRKIARLPSRPAIPELKSERVPTRVSGVQRSVSRQTSKAWNRLVRV